MAADIWAMSFWESKLISNSESNYKHFLNGLYLVRTVARSGASSVQGLEQVSRNFRTPYRWQFLPKAVRRKNRG